VDPAHLLLPDQTENDRRQTRDLMHRIDGACPPGRARHFRYRFMVHHGVEDLFSERYRVHTASPSDWSNPLYDSQPSANQPRFSATC